MKLYVLDCGQIWVEEGFLWHFGTRPLPARSTRRRPFGIRNCQYFIDHPKAKIVFDLGFTMDDCPEVRRLPPSQRSGGHPRQAGPRPEPHRPVGQDRGQAGGHRLRGHLPPHERARRLPARTSPAPRPRSWCRRTSRSTPAASGCRPGRETSRRWSSSTPGCTCASSSRCPASTTCTSRATTSWWARTWRSCRCPATPPASRT